MGISNEERRKYTRLDAELLVRYKVLSTPGKQLEATARNIGGGGICLVAREQMKNNTMIALEMKFPGSPKPIVTGGKVVWAGKCSLGASPAGHERFDNGIEFTQISDSDRQSIIERVQFAQEKGGKDWKIGIVRNISD